MTGIRFLSPAYGELATSLLGAKEVESCAVAYAHHNALCDSWVVREIVIAPTSAYESRDQISATLSSEFLMEVANRCRSTGMAAILIHTHPESDGCPSFSAIDDSSERQFGPYLIRRGGSSVHLAMVIGPGGCRARRLDNGEPVSVWEVGERLLLHSPLPTAPSLERDDRQIRAFGEAGQRLVRELHFIIVGNGGTGSVTGQQIAHLGARKVTPIDPDALEESNLNRVAGSTPEDVGQAKVDIATRMIRAINPGIEVQPLRRDVVDADVAALLPAADFIFLCTDSHASRAVVNQVAYQHLVPVIDMGVEITVKEEAITHIAGRVRMLAPGLSCLACTGTLDGEQIRQEFMTPEQRAADPYVKGVHEPQPAVISLNSTMSSLAVTMMLGAVTPVPARARSQRYDAMSGQVRVMDTTPKSGCIVCSSDGALARGDSWALPVRPAPPREDAA